MRLKNARIALSQLVAARRNPRQVKPEREAHAKLVASIRTFGFFSSLVVRPTENEKQFAVIAGQRRLAALREVHAGEADPQIPCVVVSEDSEVAQAVALAENFAREPMHPMDEAEAFGRLAQLDGKGPDAIAADFGVTEHYVRQRMKLAALAPVVKAAYRQGRIDTGTAEAFAAVPEDRQEKVWEEVGGQPRHAQHVRNIIANGWIDAKHALFDLSALPEGVVTRDLFGDQVLVERSAFMAAQTEAMEQERLKLSEEGWSHIHLGSREELYPSMVSMPKPERELDEKTTRKLAKLNQRREKLEKQLAETDENDTETAEKVSERLELLATAEEELVRNAPERYAEATKAVATVFLVLNADGRVEREYRIPGARVSARGSGGGMSADGEHSPTPPAPPTSDDLRDRQLTVTFTHHTLAVREALLEDDKIRKRVLALLLHEKVRSEALASKRDTNGVTLAASKGEEFSSATFDRLREKREKVDPLTGAGFTNDVEAYQKICELSTAKLDTLIAVLIVDCLTCHALRKTELIAVLAAELNVEFRRHWRPDAAWLAAYQKSQLSHLLAQLYGPVYNPHRESRKKSELVAVLAKLFADAAEGKLEDKALAERVNQWLPVNLRTEPQAAAEAL